ncbi:MAG TPA: helix-turn-helix transcriptional regulator [Acidimicrobiales bacterium]|nr:helix-turn-helix transcriptional regulator [Acidimicrobiales bacterium]
MPHPLKVAIAIDGRPVYQVAGAAGINPSAVSKIMAGKLDPTEPVKQRLAEVLGRPVEELFPKDDLVGGGR